MADKQYRVVSGIVQFPPREGEAGGKAVRNISVRQAGFGPTAVTVSATLWPSHDEVKVDQGDVVTLEGSYTSNKTTKQDGTPVTYHNVSVTRIFVHGKAVEGVKPETENAADEEPSDDEIPF